MKVDSTFTYLDTMFIQFWKHTLGFSTKISMFEIKGVSDDYITDYRTRYLS